MAANSEIEGYFVVNLWSHVHSMEPPASSLFSNPFAALFYDLLDSSKKNYSNSG